MKRSVYDRLLLILSNESMTSPWVKSEIARARRKERAQNRQVLFPVSLGPFHEIQEWQQFDADMGTDSAKEIREYFIPNFSRWREHGAYTSAFDKLLKALKTADVADAGP